MSRTLGTKAEIQARDYLTKQGLIYITHNYNCRCGEIDLIMRDQIYLIFIEVRARKSASFGSGIDSVTYQKQCKILKTATIYLTQYKLYNKQAVRFDVLSLDGTPPQISWIKNAFSMA